MRWVLQHKTPIAITLGIIIFIVAGIWFWGVLVSYVKPGQDGATDRKDVVQAFALIVAGVVGFIGAIVGIANLSVSRRTLQQQIELEESRRQNTLELEAQRSQDTALQAYYEQMGDLLANQDLVGSDREDIRRLAEAQTLTVVARLDGSRKRSLVRFLHGAELINKDKPIVGIGGADLREADLSNADLSNTDLSNTDLSTARLLRADLSTANLKGADMNGAFLWNANLRDADLRNADLRNAQLPYADLRGADLRDADLRDASLPHANLEGARGVTDAQLAAVRSLREATMPTGQRYEAWLNNKGSGEDGEIGGPS